MLVQLDILIVTFESKYDIVILLNPITIIRITSMMSMYIYNQLLNGFGLLTIHFCTLSEHGSLI